jgi:hypothetical protein
MGDVRAAMLRLFAAALLAVLTGQADSARADAFDDHINRGNLLYNEQNLPQAAREFEAAYRLKKQPDLLLNIGRIYLKLRRGDLAQRYCALYLTEEFEAPADRKAKATDCVTQAKLMLAGKKASAGSRPAAAPSTAATQAVEASPAAPPRAAVVPGPAAAPTPAQPPPLSNPPTASATPPLVASLALNPSVPPSASALAQEPTPRSPTAAPVEPTPPSAVPPGQRIAPPSSTEPQPNAALRLQPSASTAAVHSPERVPIYKRWWFWTILGVGAAGAAAGITAGVLSRQGPTGPVYELGDVPSDNQRTVTLGQ